MSLAGITGMHGLVGAVASDSGGFTGTPDGNTLFLSRFNTATPKNEVGSVNGTLVGNANCDLATGQLVCDGTGDWVTWAGGSTFDVTANWTIEFHTNQAAAQLGGTCSRSSSGNTRYSFYFPGDGRVQFFVEAISSVLQTVGSLSTAMNGTERHVAVCRDGGTWRLYIDGVQVDSSANATGPSNSSDDFFVGTDALLSSSRDILGRFGRVKLSNVCRYPSGTSFTPPTRFVA